MKSLITLTAEGHGTYQVTPLALTAAMAKYPSSTTRLRDILEDREPDIEWSAFTAAEMLIVLADFDHNVDSSPFRVGGALARPVITVGSEPVPMTATVTHDFLFDPTDEGDSSLVGDQTYLRVDLFEGSQYREVTCLAYDDDDILYLVFEVRVPVLDPDQETCLERLLAVLGGGWGVTRLAFLGHPELDCS